MSSNVERLKALWRCVSWFALMALFLDARVRGDDRPPASTSTQGRAFAEIEQAERLRHRGHIVDATAAAERILSDIQRGMLPPGFSWRCHNLLLEINLESGHYDAARRSGYEALRCFNRHGLSEQLVAERQDLVVRIAATEVQFAYPELRLKERLLPLPDLTATADPARRAALARAARLYRYALALPAEARPRTKAWRLAVRAELARIQSALGAAQQATSEWASILDAATTARQQIGERSRGESDYRALTRLIAVADFELGDAAQALQVLKEVLEDPSAWTECHDKAFWLGEVANVERELHGPQVEVATLTDALALLDACARPTSSDESHYRRASVEANLRYRIAVARSEDALCDADTRRVTWQNAVAACEALLARVPADAIDRLRVQLRCLTRLQTCYAELQLPNDSLTAGSELLRLLDAHVDPDDLRHAQTRAALGRAKLSQGDLMASARWLDESLAIFDKWPGRSVNARLHAVLGRAHVHVANSELRDAVELLLEEEGHAALLLGPGSPLLAQLYSTLGGLFSLEGRYADAKPRFDQAIEVLQVARTADRENPTLAIALATAQLNAAAMQRAQGQFETAFALCQTSIATLSEVRPERHVDLLPHYLLSVEVQIAQAQRIVLLSDLSANVAAIRPNANLVDEIASAAGLMETRVGARVLAQLGAAAQLESRIANSADERAGHLRHARDLWQRARVLAEHHKLVVVEVQVLNQLAGLLANESATTSAAEPLRQAADLLATALDRLEDRIAFPNLRYITLVNRAGVLTALGRMRGAEGGGLDPKDAFLQEAESHLRAAVAIAEQPRAGVLGDESARAGFFSNYAVAYDLLVDLLAERFDRDHDRTTLLEAVFVAEASRNRTLLDQVHAASLTTGMSQAGEARELADAIAVREQLSQVEGALRALDETYVNVSADEQVPAQGNLPRLKELLAQHQGLLAKLQQCDEQSVARLAESGAQAVVFRLDREAWLQDVAQLQASHPLVLCYHAGEQSSHVFLFGKGVALHRELRVDRALHEQIPELEVGPVNAVRLATLVERLRGILSNAANSGELIKQLGALRSVAPSPPASQLVQEDSVARSQQVVTTRRIDTAGDQTYPFAQVVRGMSSVILPDDIVAAIEKVTQGQPGAQLLIVPDASLHRLPFEALVLDIRHGADKAFLLDRDVVTSYAPSLSVLSRLTQRRTHSNDAPLLALTGGVRDHSVWNLQELIYAEEESNAVYETLARQLPPEGIVLLRGEACTEGALRKQLARGGLRYLHLATHAVVSTDSASQIDGRILLAPSADELPDSLDDGELRMAEIPSLELADCELVVLSACETNIGAMVPLETDASFARALFAAGVQRVVASQWSVSDRGTKILMEKFFDQLTVGSSPARSFAIALRDARRTAKGVSPAPYFWAPFVLLGPAQ